MSRRLLIISIVLVVIGALVFTAIVVNQNYTLVSEKYARMRVLTGNILLNMRDAVVSVDGNNRVTIFSTQAEELFGISAGEITGKKLEELPSTSAECLLLVFSSKSNELRLECRPGFQRIVSVSLSSSSNPDGSVESRTAVIKDLTEARQLEQEVQRTGKLKAMGELASGVAHEIRNPLNAISMIAQRYEREFSPRKGLREYRSLTNVLKRESARVNNIVQQFLTFARPPKLRTSEVSIEQFLHDITTLFEGQAKGKGVRFSMECRAKGFVRIDSGQMTQALLNLLQNALDATPKRGAISLLAVRAGNDITVSVIDNGTGIRADQLNKVFDLYFTTKPDGTGMGLAITQQIVSQHGGRLDVVSEVGKGSTFSITIPSAKP